MEDNITCKDVMEHICDNLGEQLNSPRCRAIKAHLESCNGCQNYKKSVETTIDFYRQYNVEMPDGAHGRLITFLGLGDNNQ